MNLPLSREKLETLWNKYRWVVIIILAGLILMLIPATEEVAVEEPLQERETFSLDETEQRMEEILSRIEGTGKLQLMLTLKSGSQLQLAEDIDESADNDETRTQRETVTLNRGSGYEDIVITRQEYPVYQGALVVCQGADKASVRLALTEAVAALTGLSSDKISIVKWNS